MLPMTQEIAFPPVGHTFIVDFGEAVFHTTFDSAHHLTFAPVKGNLGATETVDYKTIEIHPPACLLYWQEKDTTTVTGYRDFEKMIVYSNVTLPGNKFLNLCGKLTLMSASIHELGF
jgi:MoaF-like